MCIAWICVTWLIRKEKPEMLFADEVYRRTPFYLRCASTQDNFNLTTLKRKIQLQQIDTTWNDGESSQNSSFVISETSIISHRRSVALEMLDSACIFCNTVSFCVSVSSILLSFLFELWRVRSEAGNLIGSNTPTHELRQKDNGHAIPPMLLVSTNSTNIHRQDVKRPACSTTAGSRSCRRAHIWMSHVTPTQAKGRLIKQMLSPLASPTTAMAKSRIARSQSTPGVRSPIATVSLSFLSYTYTHPLIRSLYRTHCCGTRTHSRTL